MRAEAAETIPELLLACARVHLDPAARATIGRLVARGPDWEGLLQAARVHGLRPLVCWHLGERGEGGAPETIRRRLSSLLHEIRLRNVARTAELVRLVMLLRQARVRVLPYKGPVLAATLHGDLGLREFVDLDLLVPPDEVPAARRVLTEAGLRPILSLTSAQEAAHRAQRYEHVFVRKPDGLLVELQWRVAPAHFGFDLSHEALWERRIPVVVAGRVLEGLGDQDLFLVLAVHGAKHVWARLGWVVDLAELMRARPGLDWGVLGSRARDLGVERILRLSLLLVTDLLGATVPAEPLAEARGDPVAVALAREVGGRVGTGDAPGGLTQARFHLRMRERARDRRRYALGLTLATTPGDWAVVPLPRLLFPLYYVVRPLRVALKYGGMATRMLRREGLRQ